MNILKNLFSDSMTPAHRVPRERRGDALPGLIMALLVVLVMVIATLATEKIEQRADIAELQRQIEAARLTKKQQCWNVAGRNGEPAVTLCATPWRGF